VATVVAQEVPTSSTMALPYGPAGVGDARRRLRKELRDCGAPETVIDDATLILSELLSNAYRHGRPIDNGRGEPGIRVGWHVGEDGLLTLEVTDGGGPTRPSPSSPSLTAHGGRGLGIVETLSLEWGVTDRPGEVTVWAILAVRGRHARRNGVGARLGMTRATTTPDVLRRYGSLFDDVG
jgi:anti-sigma regulatory factor (Ser/Thr protein kinase)